MRDQEFEEFCASLQEKFTEMISQILSQNPQGEPQPLKQHIGLLTEVDDDEHFAFNAAAVVEIGNSIGMKYLYIGLIKESTNDDGQEYTCPN